MNVMLLFFIAKFVLLIFTSKKKYKVLHNFRVHAPNYAIIILFSIVKLTLFSTK